MNFIKIILLSLFSLLFIASSYADINFSFTPIKYEIVASTGSTVTKTASFTNHTNDNIYVETSKSDFRAKDQFGSPSFVRKSEVVFDDQLMSEWITIDTDSFFIAPKETVEITFRIDIPTDAPPGGHYSAVFFKPNDITGGADINIKVDYGILILLTVQGDIDMTGEVDDDDIVISTGGGGKYNNYNKKPDGSDISKTDKYSSKDYCPLGDLTTSKYDGKCIDNPFNYKKKKEISAETDINNNQENEEEKDEEEDFRVDFEIPFDNKGNTHIKPSGKIIIIDENGDEIDAIGRRFITDDSGVIVGEEIVDYIPINDTGGNVLPGTRRVFGPEWKGFPYKGINGDGEYEILFQVPGEYYSNKNINNNRFLMLWERVEEERRKKTLKALISVEYLNEDGELIEFNSAKEFDIEYTEKVIGLNPYVAIPLAIIGFIFGIFKLIGILRRKKCKKCKKKIKKNVHNCPHCGKKNKN